MRELKGGNLDALDGIHADFKERVSFGIFYFDKQRKSTGYYARNFY